MPPVAIIQTMIVCNTVAARKIVRLAEQNGAGYNSHAWAEPCWIKSGKDGMERSQIFGDFLEFVDSPSPLLAERRHRVLQAMIEMVGDQRFLSLANRFLDRMKLLGNVDTGTAGLDHLDDGAQMTFAALQPLDDFRMRGVKMGLY